MKSSLLLCFFITFLAAIACSFTSAQGSMIPGSSSWTIYENMILELEIQPNASAPIGGVCGFDFSPSAASMICRMLNRPVPVGRTAGILLAPHGTNHMYINGISCTPDATNFGNCSIINFDPAGRACDPQFGIGVDCTGVQVGPSYTFYTFFRPTATLLNNLNTFLFYFKNALVGKLDIIKTRIRVMGLTANLTSGVVNCTWHILDADDGVQTTRAYAEYQFIQQAGQNFFGPDMNMISYYYTIPATPPPPTFDFSSWSFRLSGTGTHWVGLFGIKTSPTATWGTACGIWTDKEAECACHQMGYTMITPHAINFYSGGTGPLVMWDVECNSQIMLQNCNFKTSVTNNVSQITCNHGLDVGMDCYYNTVPPITPVPGTAAPPLYNGTIIGWNATIYKDILPVFCNSIVGVGGSNIPASRCQIISTITTDPNYDYVFFRFTDAQMPSRRDLDFDLSVTDSMALELLFGIVHLTNNVTGTSDDPTNGIIRDYWDVKLITTGALISNMGLINVRPRNATTNNPWGTVCTGFVEHYISAMAFCKSAGINGNTYNMGGMIPYYGKASGSGPIYLTDVVCDMGHYLDNCTYLKCDGTGNCPSCPHSKDMGAVCYNIAPIPQTTPEPTAMNVLMYTAVLSDPDYTQLPIEMGAYLPFGYDRIQFTFEENLQTGTTIKFYFSDPVPQEVYAPPTAVINAWLQSISSAGRTALFNMKSLSWAMESVTPAPTLAPQGSDSLEGFEFRIRKLEEEIRYNEVGLIEVRRPGATTWGTVCNNDFTFVEAFAMCVTLGYPSANPTFRSLSELYGSAIPVDIQSQPIDITHAFCPTISDEDTIHTCSVTLWETNTYDCTHEDDVVIDCYDTNRKLPAILFKTFVPLFNYSRATFLAGFQGAFNVSTERVVIESEVPYTSPEGYQFMYIFYYFIDDWTVFADDGSVMPPGSISSMGGSTGGSNGMGGGGSGFMNAREGKVQENVEQQQDQQQQLPPPALLSNSIENNNNNDNKQQKKVKPGPWVVGAANYRVRRAAFAQETTWATYTQPPGEEINYDEFTRAQIDWSGKHWMYAAGYQALEFEMWLFNPSELWKYFSAYEIRKNSTRPNGPIDTNQNNWNYQLAATLHSGLNHTHCQSTAATCYGRVEVQMGNKAPWGTVCSVGSDDETALILCRKFNPTISKGLIIPTYNYGQGFIALSDISCPPVSTNPIINQCTKKASDHDTKRNLCNHNMDMGVMCGVNVAPRLARASVFEVTIDFQVFNTTWFPDTFQRFTGLPAKRINMWDGKNTLWYEYWNLDGLPVVKFNMTFEDAQFPGDYTREDLELFLQLHSPWGLYELYGIIEYVNYGPVPLHVNATRVTSYVPYCNRSQTGGTCANETQTPPPTTMVPTMATTKPATTTTKAPTMTTTKAPSTTAAAGPTTTRPSTTMAPPTTAGPTTTKAPTTTLAPGQTTTKAPSTTAAPTTTKAPTTTLAPGQTTTAAAPTTTGVAPSTTASAPSTTAAGPTTTLAPGQTTTAAAPTTTGVAPSTTAAAPTTTGAPVPTTTLAPGQTTTAAAPTTTGVAPSTTAAGPTTTLAPGQTTTAAAPTTTGIAPSTTAPAPSTTAAGPTTTLAPGQTTTAAAPTTTGAPGESTTQQPLPTTTSGAAPTTSAVTPAPIITTTAAPALVYRIDFTIPSNVTATKFVENLSNLLGVQSGVLTFSVVGTNAAGQQIVRVVFPNEPLQQKALGFNSQENTDLGIISAAANDAPATPSPPSPSSGDEKNNLPLIAGAAGGGLLVLVIVGFIIYKKKSSSGSSNGSNRSGPVDINYNALMADTFDQQELHLTRESDSVQV